LTRHANYASFCSGQLQAPLPFGDVPPKLRPLPIIA
jgi:hypothetical protein